MHVNLSSGNIRATWGPLSFDEICQRVPTKSILDSLAPSPDSFKQDMPPVLMHYMPWFHDSDECGTSWKCQHWKMQLDWNQLRAQKRVAAHFTPLIGPYDSADRAVIRYHIRLMQLAGIRGLVINWYGVSDTGDFPDNRIASDTIVDVATELGDYMHQPLSLYIYIYRYLHIHFYIDVYI